MAVDANGLEEALSVIFKTWEKETATRYDSENNVGELRKHQHQRAGREQTNSLYVKHATQYSRFDQKYHSGDNSNQRRQGQRWQFQPPFNWEKRSNSNDTGTPYMRNLTLDEGNGAHPSSQRPEDRSPRS